jgi:DNA-binding GntR family transcriptional regulator
VRLAALKPYDVREHWAADEAVHALIIDHCGNGVMAQMLRSMRVTTHLFEVDRLRDRLGPDQREHLAILDALSDAQPEAARAAAAMHCRSLIAHALDAVGVGGAGSAS